MRYINFMLVGLFVLSGLSVSAQYDNGGYPYRLPVDVLSLEARAEGESVDLFMDVQVMGCSDELIVNETRHDSFILLDVQTAGSLDDVFCGVSAPQAANYTLDRLAPANGYTLAINGRFFRFALATPSDDAFLTLSADPALLVDNAYIPADNATLSAQRGEDGSLQIQLEGQITENCASQPYWQLVPDAVQEDVLHLYFGSLMDLRLRCAVSTAPYEQAERTVYSADRDWQLVLHGTDRVFWYDAAVDETTARTRFPVGIEAVTTQRFDTGASLTLDLVVDSCDAITQQSVRETSEAVFVELWRDVADTSIANCPQTLVPVMETITLDGLTEDTNRPIVINGGVYPPRTDDSETNDRNGGNFMRVNTVIEDVQVEVAESFPMQIVLSITGYQPDGCDVPVQVVQTINGNDVTVEIFRELPEDVGCPMMIVPYEEAIRLDATFTDGTVNIRINELEIQQDL